MLRRRIGGRFKVFEFGGLTEYIAREAVSSEIGYIWGRIGEICCGNAVV